MMNKKEFLHLKSGTDVRGTAVETAEHGVQLTDETVQKICVGFYKWYCRKEQVDTFGIAVGQDCRISSPRIAAAALAAFCACGCRVFDCGLATTPSMFMSIVENEPVQTALEITASHHPFDRNGLKFFTSGGGLEGEDVSAILELAYDAEVPAGTDNAPVELPFMNDYAALLRRQIVDGVQNGDRPLEGLHIVVDAGNGAGGFYAELLESLGAWIEGSQFLEPDGHFPNHIPNPENAQAMASLREAVLRVGADLGVIFDADCDRAAIVDADGREINRNRLIALISAILLDEKPGQTIVTDSVTSSGLKRFINDWGGEHYRYKRGYRNVIDEAIRLNAEGVECPLAIETSGHAALKENHFLDDGMYLVTVLIVRAMKLKQQGQTLGSLIADLQEPVESVELRLNIQEEDFREAGKRAIQKVLDYANAAEKWHIAPDNREGVRISFDLDGGMDNGWFLLRLSVHDPVLPLNVESDVPGGVKQMLQSLYQVLLGCTGIDLSPIEKMLQGDKTAQ